VDPPLAPAVQANSVGQSVSAVQDLGTQWWLAWSQTSLAEQSASAAQPGAQRPLPGPQVIPVGRQMPLSNPLLAQSASLSQSFSQIPLGCRSTGPMQVAPLVHCELLVHGQWAVQSPKPS
jgi:hypothetical protein